MVSSLAVVETSRPSQLHWSSTTLELSTKDLDELPLSLLGDLDLVDKMPWFRRLWFGKKRNKKAKKEISEPSGFQHFYHATVDNASGEFLGLPPQWVSLVSSAIGERPQKSPSSSGASSETVQPIVASAAQPLLETRTTAGACVVEPTGSVLTVGSEEMDRGSRVAVVSEGEKTPGTDRSVSSSPVSAVTHENASTRPIPIIRGSDGCLEETIKYIRKHYRSASSASPCEEETAEEQYVDIHFGSRSRSGSLMQLRGGNRGNNAARSSSRTNVHVVPYTSSSTNTMNNSNIPNIPLSSNSAFCMSAPHDLNVVQSDLGLYDCDTSSASNTTLFRTRIHSPSESSGYFGSTMSSLCSSRVSALSSIPQIPATAGTPQNPVTAMQHRYTTLHETTEAPWLHPQMKPGQPYFSSLQRPGKYYRDGGSHATPRAYAHGNIGSNIAALASSPPGHYGTAPRAYAHRPRGESVDNGLYRYYRERTQPESRLQYNRGPVSNASTATLTESHSHTPAHPCYSSSGTSRNAQPVNRSKRQRKPMTIEQFRTTLELLVNKSDPRKDLREVGKVGEGSTGVVVLAQRISTGKNFAVKKMNLRRQQRRELLFNEVRLLYYRGTLYMYMQAFI